MDNSKSGFGYFKENKRTENWLSISIRFICLKIYFSRLITVTKKRWNIFTVFFHTFIKLTLIDQASFQDGWRAGEVLLPRPQAEPLYGIKVGEKPSFLWLLNTKRPVYYRQPGNAGLHLQSVLPHLAWKREVLFFVAVSSKPFWIIWASFSRVISFAIFSILEDKDNLSTYGL